jgi:histidinol phosphatase-like PHP family hydrolase
MGLLDGIKKAVENVADAVNEAGHKSTAEGEHAKREVAGDAMTPGENVKSIVNEGKENLLGGVDHAKREIRENT